MCATVLRHPKLYFYSSEGLTHNDPRGYRSLGTIAKNEVLLIEHCFHHELETEEELSAGVHPHMLDLILCDARFFNELWPRDNQTLWREENLLSWTKNVPRNIALSPSLTALIEEKYDSNAFVIGGRSILGYESVGFNHADRPNTDFHCIFARYPEVGAFVFLVFTALRDIEANEEITVMYNEDISFNGKGEKVVQPNLACVPEEGKARREEFHGRISSMVKTKHLAPYLLTDTFRHILKTQYMFKKGLFYHEDHAYLAPRFIEEALRTHTTSDSGSGVEGGKRRFAIDAAVRSFDQKMLEMFRV